MLRVYKASDTGRVRQNNEDSLLIGDRDNFLVADGMGGHAAGEIASSMLVDTLARELPRPEVILDELGLEYLIKKANQEILADITEHPERKGMGATATLLHVGKDKIIWAHIGDSRLYRLREGTLTQLTNDHSLVEEMVRMGTLTPEEAKNHPQKNVLLRAVGVEQDINVDTDEDNLQDGDIYMLCSDGLTNMVDDEEIRTVLQSTAGIDKAQTLVDLANEYGGRDNITVIVVEYYA